VWYRDFDFEKQLRYDIEKAHQVRLQKERLEALELNKQIVGHSHESQVLKGARAKILINGKEMALSDGEISFNLIDRETGKIEEVSPAIENYNVEFTVQLHSPVSDQDIVDLRAQFNDAINSSNVGEWRTPIYSDDEIEQAGIAVLKEFGVPDKLIGGRPLEIEEFDFPPLKVHEESPDKKDASDHAIDELNRALGIKK
jgi:hypothetical protein